MTKTDTNYIWAFISCLLLSVGIGLLDNWLDPITPIPTFSDQEIQIICQEEGL